MKLSLVSLIIFSTACTKNEVSEATTACYECNDGYEAADVCEEDGVLFVDGEEIDNPNEYTLKEFIDLIHENPNNDPDLEGFVCTKN